MFKKRKTDRRRATTLVEFALVLPVFGLMLMAILEFGHIYMVYNTMTAAAKRAARYGSVSGVTNQQVEDKVDSILGSVIDMSEASVIVKDASVFDAGEDVDEALDYEELDDIALDELEPRQLFLIYITVPYDDVALLPPFWADNLTLTAQSVMRHE